MSTEKRHVSELHAGSIGVVAAIAASAAFIAPAVSVTAGNVFLAGFTGAASPLAYIVGTLVCIALAIVIVDFAKKLPSAGSFYTYLTRAFGARAGFVTGVLLFGAYVILLPLQAAFFGTFTSGVAASAGLHVPWQVWAIVLMAISTTCALVGARPSLRIGLVGVTFELALFTILSLVIVIKGGHTGNSVQPFEFSHSFQGVPGILLATVYTIFGFVGFESATTLGEEAKNPRRTIPRAVLGTCIVIGVFYVLSSYAEVIGFGISPSGLHELQNNLTPFTSLSHAYIGGWYATLINIATISSFIALNIATVTCGSRMIFAMGRDGVLPRAFAKVNGHRSPSVAALAVGMWGVLVPLVAGGIWGAENSASWFSYLATLLLVGAYAMLAVGVVRFYRRDYRSEFSWLRHGFVPLLALAGIGCVLYGNIHPLPPAPLRYFIYVAIAIAIGAYLVAACLDRRNPQLMREAGQLFAAVEDAEPSLAVAQPGQVPLASPPDPLGSPK
jgi:amino acid transporter